MSSFYMGFYYRANLYATVGMLGRIINWLTARETTRIRIGIRLGFRVNESRGEKKWTEFSKKKNELEQIVS